jgi:Protein of unknown function (DUF998)
MQKKVSVVSLNPWWNQAARWLALIGGVINPIAFVLTYTVAGFLRPGYSPIHQAISDLGVGSNGSLLDTLAVISGLLLIAFVVGFALSIRRVVSRMSRSTNGKFAHRGIPFVLERMPHPDKAIQLSL